MKKSLLTGSLHISGALGAFVGLTLTSFARLRSASLLTHFPPEVVGRSQFLGASAARIIAPGRPAFLRAADRALRE